MFLPVITIISKLKSTNTSVKLNIRSIELLVSMMQQYFVVQQNLSPFVLLFQSHSSISGGSRQQLAECQKQRGGRMLQLYFASGLIVVATSTIQACLPLHTCFCPFIGATTLYHCLCHYQYLYHTTQKHVHKRKDTKMNICKIVNTYVCYISLLSDNQLLFSFQVYFYKRTD